MRKRPPFPGDGKGGLSVSSATSGYSREGLVLQLVNVFEDQLADGLTGAGSVNLEADLCAFRDGGGHLLHRLGGLGRVLEGLLEAGALGAEAFTLCPNGKKRTPRRHHTEVPLWNTRPLPDLLRTYPHVTQKFKSMRNQ